MKVREMMYVSLFAAVVCALGLIPPLPVPIIAVPVTAQTLGVMLAGAMLGARLGGLSLLVFVLLVAAGAPVLSGGRGGIGVLFGSSGGYILSYPLAAFVIGLLVDRLKNVTTLKLFFVNILGGILIIYAFGIPYYAFIMDMPLGVVALGNLSFIPGDLMKAILAAVVIVKVRRASPMIQKRRSKNV